MIPLLEDDFVALVAQVVCRPSDVTVEQSVEEDPRWVDAGDHVVDVVHGSPSLNRSFTLTRKNPRPGLEGPRWSRGFFAAPASEAPD